MFTRTLQGHTHQGLLVLQCLSSSFGTQCTAIAFVALLFASFHTYPSTWGSHHLVTIVFERNSLYRAIVREQFNGDITTLLTHSDLSSDLTVFGGLYQQRLGAKYFGAANYLPANLDADGHTLNNDLYQALTTPS